jgi:dolichol-phosphate mannosyltransferase
MITRQPFVTYQNSFVTIVVPVFNEADKIVQNLQLLIREIEPHFDRFEVLVISDGSTDGTNRILTDLQMPNVRILLLERNMGKGHAVRVGFNAAKGDYIFFIDGGMELHPRELRIFFGLMSLYDADIVVGSKRHPQSRVFYPWYRRILSRIFQYCIRLAFKINVTDTQVGMKLFKGEVVRAILPHLQINRYGFDLELLSLAHNKGYTKILEAPVALDYFVAAKRFIFLDIIHVLRVGVTLLADTWLLYRNMKNLKLKS